MSERMGVLFLQAQDGFGADSAVHADIIRNLDRDKFVVHIACTAGTGEGVPPSLAILRELPDVKLRVTRFAPSLGQRDARALIAGARAGLDFSADFLALRRYVSEQRIRVIHSTERPRDAVYNVALARLTGARSAVHVHVKWSEQYKKLARLGVQHADAVFSISRYVTETLVRMGRAPASIYTVLNGIDPAKWDPATDGSTLRQELGVASDALVLASVSRLFSWKGQRELIRALASLKDEFQNLKLLIVGNDAVEVEGSSFSDELKTLAGSLGVLDRIIFTGGRSDVPRVMAACDVFTLPSFEEPFGLVFLEAMAMRRPVVAVNNGGTPEVVEHGTTGLLSPPLDVPALAANIATLLRDATLRAEMGARGRERVLERFTAQRMAREVGAAYERIVQQ